MMKDRYFSYQQAGSTADIWIFGDITSWPWTESDVSSYNLSQLISALPPETTDVDVHINSYGGEVAEGVAIYNALRNSGYHVRTICDGFACSIASVVFMAGDERLMNDASLLFVHNASTFAAGTAEELRKQADDLDTVTELSKTIYLEATDLTQDELSRLMDDETFLGPDYAVEHGFATGRVPAKETAQATQSARSLVSRRLVQPLVRPYVRLTFDDEQLDDVVHRVMQRLEDPDELDESEVPDTPEDTEASEGLEDSEEKTSERCAAFFAALAE